MNNQNLNLNKDSKNQTLAILIYVLGFVFNGLGILALLIPLGFLLFNKDEYIKKHAKNILNWQLTFFFLCNSYCYIWSIIVFDSAFYS
jgi:uncharacterized Tic20 family protein